MTPANEQPAASHVDLILQQIGSLPTLSPVAVKLMRLAESGEADLHEVARLISADPAMTTKVLSLCRRSDLGISARITTVDRAVVMLGLDAVRAALLSVEVHEAFNHAIERTKSAKQPKDNAARDGDAFDRRELWRHCIGVAAAAELIAEAHHEVLGDFTAQEAFLAGLLHDLGKLALDAILPKSYARVAEIAHQRQSNIAEVERKVIGIDHHTVGKRLAEHWGLPHALLDVMWLHGQPAHLLPEVSHRGLINIITVADVIARRQHLGWSGNFAAHDDFTLLCRNASLDPDRCNGLTSVLHERVAQRCRDLGLDEATPAAVLFESLARANSQLGRVTELLDQRARESERGGRVLEAIARFLAAEHQRKSFAAALDDLGRSAREVLGDGSYTVITQPREGAPWLFHRLHSGATPSEHIQASPPEGHASLAELVRPGAPATRQGIVLSWIESQIRPASRDSELRMLPLIGTDGGLSALLIHDRPEIERHLTAKGLEALAASWGAALASASRHDGARRMSEQIADTNRKLAEAQSRLVEQRSMIRLGELAAGAAHEMNNPLTVISGLGQSLAEGIADPEKRVNAARAVVKASEKLSELITSLHLFADPPPPERAPCDITELLQQSVRLARHRAGTNPRIKASAERLQISIDPRIGSALLDAKQIAQAVSELVVNALQSGPNRIIEIRAQIDPFDDRLIFTVKDDGCGMSAHALEHACDPFFSELPAGRRTGLGLTRARRYVDLHGGELTLESEPEKGTIARIKLPEWRAQNSQQAGSEAA